MTARRVLVCGSRTLDDYPAVLSALRGVKPTTVIEGGCAGADRLARKAARELGVALVTVDADWARYGKAAGPIRNQRMLDEFHPDLVFAFPGAGSRGTYDMIRRAEAAGVPVVTFPVLAAVSVGGEAT